MIEERSAVETKKGDRISDYAVFDCVLRDITERKKAVEMLKGSKNFAERLIASMKDGFSITDNHGVHVGVNKALCHTTGFTREELIGTGPPHPYWPEEEYENIEKAIQKTSSGEFSDFELIFKRKSGERFPVIVSPSRIKDTEGNILVYFQTVKDVTELKRLEKKEKELAAMDTVNAMSDGVILIDIDGKITSVNPAWEKMTGYESSEVVGKDAVEVAERMHKPEDAKKLSAALRTAMKGEVPNSLVYTLIRKDGQEITITYTPSFIRDAAGKPTQILGTVKDLTEIKKAEEEIRKLSYAVEQAIDGIAICDLELTMTYVNNAFARMHGYSAEEMIGMKVENLHNEEQTDEYVDGMNQAKTEGSWISETQHRKKDGTSFPAYRSITTLTDKDGNRTGFLVVTQVVTQILNEVIWHAAQFMNGETNCENAMNEIVRTINPLWDGGN